jgi:hypothetical protein
MIKDFRESIAGTGSYRFVGVTKAINKATQCRFKKFYISARKLAKSPIGSLLQLVINLQLLKNILSIAYIRLCYAE